MPRVSFRKLVGRIIFISLLLGAAVLTPTSVAQAEVYNCGTQGNWFDGYYENPSYLSNPPADWYEGASTYIVTREGLVCDTNTSSSNFATGWSMIAAGNGSGWAQSGYFRSYGSSITYFSQIASDSTHFQTVFRYNPILGSTHAYRSLYWSGCGCIQTTVDSTVFQQSTFNPYGRWSFPFVPQFFGETAYRESDMPGLSSSPMTFWGLGVQRYTDDVLVSIPCILLSRVDSTRWGLSPSGCTAFNVYTH